MVFAVARVGFEPTASLVLSQSGLPVAYRAVLISGAPEIRTRAPTLALVHSACNTDVFPLDERPICFASKETSTQFLVRVFLTLWYREQESNRLNTRVALFHAGRVRLSADGVSAVFMRVVLDGIEPSFPACKTGVVAVGPQDCICRSGACARDFFWFVLTFRGSAKTDFTTDDGTCKSPDLLDWNQALLPLHQGRVSSGNARNRTSRRLPHN